MLLYNIPSHECVVSSRKKEKKKNLNASRTNDRQTIASRCDAVCSCILDRPLLLSRTTDNPFNLKEWKVSCQQVKRKSSRRMEGTGKKDDQVRGYRRRTELGMRAGGEHEQVENFSCPIGLARSVCIFPFFYSSTPCNKIVERIEDAKVTRLFQWKPTTIGRRRPDCRFVISSN